jgi:predicted  nucleic acid-binding Zn-ribbon protein
MTDSVTVQEVHAAPVEEGGNIVESTPEANKNNSVVLDLWGGEDTWNTSAKEESHTSDNLKIEFETLTIERERLRKENKRLAEMLESIKLEEELAALKEEVSALGGQNQQLLDEIQRRRQSIMKG